MFGWVLREKEEGQRDGVGEKGKGRSDQGTLGREAQVVTGQILLETRLEREGWNTSAG